MDKYNEAEMYYQRELDQLQISNQENIAEQYYSLKRLVMEKGKCELSLEQFHKSLEIRKSDDPDVVDTQNYNGNIYQLKGDYEQALK